MKDTSGPAFPNTHSTEYLASSTAMIETTGGMTLREYFAAKAMAAIISNTDTLDRLASAAKQRGMPSDAAISEASFEFADAMLAERSKP